MAMLKVERHWKNVNPQSRQLHGSYRTWNETITNNSSLDKKPSKSNGKTKPLLQNHEFNLDSRTLQLGNTELTVHKYDLRRGPIQCTAKIFQDVSAIRAELEAILGPGFEPGSTMVGYHFEHVSRLQSFAQLRIPCNTNVTLVDNDNRSHLHVWKIEKDGGVHTPIEIPRKDSIDVDDETVDYYYEMESSNSVVNIYLKTFCLLVCTLCGKPGDAVPYKLEEYSIHAYVYIKEEAGVVRVIAYLVDNLLANNYQMIKDCRGGKEPNFQRQVTMPARASLEKDKIALKLLHVDSEACNWTCTDADEKVVLLSSITSCHSTKKGGAPFSHEWVLSTLANRQGRPPNVVKFRVEIRPEFDYVGYVHRVLPDPTVLIVSHELESSDILNQYETAGAAVKEEDKASMENDVIFNVSRTVAGDIPNSSDWARKETSQLPDGSLDSYSNGLPEPSAIASGFDGPLPRGELDTNSLNSLQEIGTDW